MKDSTPTVDLLQPSGSLTTTLPESGLSLSQEDRGHLIAALLGGGGMKTDSASYVVKGELKRESFEPGPSRPIKCYRKEDNVCC